MSKLVIIRHGQASYGAADYDQLSDLGTSQSEQLGMYIAKRSSVIDAIYCGPRKRHQQTCVALMRGAANAGMVLPEPKSAAGLDEFPAFELYRMHHPNRSTDSSDTVDPKDADKKFPKLCQAWMLGTLDSGHLESAEQFEQRVGAVFHDISEAQQAGKNVLVITSGGPMMIAMKIALGLAPETACKLLWVTANTALSEFRCRDNQLGLLTFNNLAHLNGENITYR